MRLRRLFPLTLIALAAASTAVAAPVAPPLTADGWGKLRMGMSEAALSAAFKFKLPPEETEGCREFDFPAAGPDVGVITEDGRVTRIYALGGSRLKTAGGLGIGSTTAQVRRAYGRRLKVEPNFYVPSAGQYLTVWSPGRKRGIRFESNQAGVVDTIVVGGRSFEFIEVCLAGYPAGGQPPTQPRGRPLHAPP